MKTISKAVSEWLSGYEGLVIDTERIKDGSDKYGLFRSPNRLITEFADGSYTVKEYYSLLAKQSAISNEERLEADEFLENFCYWADDFYFDGEYPDIGGNRRITRIEVTGSPTAMITSPEETTYQISLAVSYTRDREE